MRQSANYFSTLMGGVLLLAIVFGFVFFIPRTSISPNVSINFEQSVWKNDTKCCKWLQDAHAGRTFQVVMQGDRQLVSAWLDSSIARSGRQSLALRLTSPPAPVTTKWQSDPRYEKQRAELELSNGHYLTHHLEEERTYSVSLYIDPESAPYQKKGIFFMQADQSHDTSSAKYPAFFLRFKDNSAYKWEVNVASDGNADSRMSKGTPLTIYSSTEPLAIGEWHDFTVYFKPSVKQQGAIKVWHNGTLAVSQTNKRNYGYKPQPKPHVMNDYFWVRFGAYRRPEPDKLGDVLLRFDDARIEVGSKVIHKP